MFEALLDSAASEGDTSSLNPDPSPTPRPSPSPSPNAGYTSSQSSEASTSKGAKSWLGALSLYP